MRWMYLLMLVPALTDLIETGRYPASAREWVTEVVAGAVIGVLVRKVRMEHLAVLALSRCDMLTGLWNRRAFEEAIQDECERARRSRQPLSLVYMDLDNFKQVNDRHGHDAGDRILQQLASGVSQVTRSRVDRGFRVGGDEFAVLFPGSKAGQARAAMRRIREHCARLDPLWVGGPLGVSAGIVELDARETTVDFVRRADDAMYREKSSRGSRGGQA